MITPYGKQRQQGHRLKSLHKQTNPVGVMLGCCTYGPEGSAVVSLNINKQTKI